MLVIEWRGQQSTAARIPALWLVLSVKQQTSNHA